jgi:hypothetical protein
MVMPQTESVHAEPAIPVRRPAFPQGARSRLPGPGSTPGQGSELGNQLRPDRHHPDEKRERSQRRSLFHECLQHARLLLWEHKKNIVPFLFSESSGGRGSVWKLTLKNTAWLTGTRLWRVTAGKVARKGTIQWWIGAETPPPETELVMKALHAAKLEFELQPSTIPGAQVEVFLTTRVV